jgi:peptidoglycan/LPS O-acetylase OafA/YrhL
MKIEYRPEIDGLRAIAVCSVILYHAKINFFGYSLSGGFIGVDIFFVISGYLITSIILKEFNTTGNFFYKNFYERRIRRILPVLIFIMLVTLPIAWIYLMPSGFVNFSKSLLYSLGFSSNFFFYYLGEKYGADSGLYLPFLHTWSLSIEEQYYIIFPPILILCLKYFKKYLPYFLIFIFILSLFLAQWLSKNYSSLNFFILPTRVWELAFGSMLAYCDFNEIKLNKKNSLNYILPFVGLLLIFYSLFFFNDEILHPSILTLLPIMGTGMIIYFGYKKEIVTRLLSCKLFVGIGLISYSLYLWHYPIFAFNRISYFTKSSSLKEFFLGFLVLLLSIFTYYFIEKPARNKKYSFKKILSIIFLAIFFVAFFSSTIILSKGWPSRFDYTKKANINYDIDNDKYLKIWSQFKKINKINFTPNNKTKILFLGDSHSQDMFNIFYLNKDLFNNYEYAQMDLNKNYLNIKTDHNFRKSDVVVLTVRWIYKKDDYLNNLQNITNFLKKNNKKIIIMSNTNEYHPRSGKFTLIDHNILDGNFDNYFELKSDYYSNRLINSQSEINIFLSDFSLKNDLIYLNKEDYLCDEKNKECDYVTPSGYKIFYDYGHYTIEGAKYLGKKIYKTGWFKIPD